MTAIRAAKLAREPLLTGIVREALVSGSGAVLPSDVVVRAAALAREALLAEADTFRLAAMVREAPVSEA